MTSRALRLALLVVFVGLLAGAAYIIWQEETAAADAAHAGRAFDDALRGASRSLLEIKSAQPGYVAAGQGEDFWVRRVDTLLASARTALTDLEPRAESAGARAALQQAAEGLRDFEQMDRRARSYARSGQRLLASDLIFSDGIERIDGALAALDRARDEERLSRDAAAQERRTAQLAAAGAAAAGGVLVMLAVVPLPAAARRRTVSTPEPAAESEPSLSLVPNPAAASQPLDAHPADEIRREPAQSANPVEPAVDLPAIATLCTDLARVLDRQALPEALARAARILNASGIVIWIADPDGRELVPVMAHGYPQNVLIRLGRIERDAENVTAAAYRTGLVQTLRADEASNGAIAAPLIAGEGPVGVMAAEVLDRGEGRGETRAAAAIIAAQLATLMGPPPVRAEAAGAG